MAIIPAIEEWRSPAKANSLWILLNIVADFIIFSFPAFLVYASSFWLRNVKKWHIKGIKDFVTKAFWLHIGRLIKTFVPSILVIISLYLLGALIRGDIGPVVPDKTELKEYCYLLGVFITSLLFGFADLFESTNTENALVRKSKETIEIHDKERNQQLLENNLREIRRQQFRR